MTNFSFFRKLLTANLGEDSAPISESNSTILLFGYLLWDSSHRFPELCVLLQDDPCHSCYRDSIAMILILSDKGKRCHNTWEGVMTSAQERCWQGRRLRASSELSPEVPTGACCESSISQPMRTEIQ
jgi:hypothetical protein